MDVAPLQPLRHIISMNEHERGFLKFLQEPGRRRLATLLELGEKRRRDARQLLHHAVNLDSRFSRHLTGNDTSHRQIEAILREHGAPAICYVFGNGELDGTEVPLADGLSDIIGMGNGGFVSCIPGKLGYFEYESIKSSYLLLK